MYDIAAIDPYSSIVVKNCAHPNAATLILLYLSSPDGAKWAERTWYAGNSHYPRNWLYESVKELKEKGGKVMDLGSMKEYIDFMNSDERKKMQDEANAILVSGKRK
jgi:hypothetical protein